MKQFILITALMIAAQFSHADTVLENCYASNRAEFFASDLEEIAIENETPVLLLNEEKEVVGVISVSPKRRESYPSSASEVEVKKISLCGSLQTSDFYYTDSPADNLLNWIHHSDLEVTQDEGMIRLNAKIESKESYATLVRVDFKAYDVFNDEEFSDKEKKNPDFIEDWGVPKGKGTFYFYVPKNWNLKP